MLIFDSHCDSATSVLTDQVSLNERTAGRQFDFASAVGVTDLQVMAFFVDKEPQEAVVYDDFLDYYYRLMAQIRANDRVVLVTEAAQLASWQQGPLGVLLAVEGAEILGHDLHRLMELHQLGIRALTITWNNDNALASGNGSLQDNGLTALGKKAVREMNRLGIAVDIAHLAPKGIRDILSMTDRPIIDSHGNCAALYPHSRNLTDEQIKALAATGGVLGVTYVPKFLRADERQATAEDLVDHIAHVAYLVGTEYVGLGSDFDGTQPLRGLAHVSEVPALAERLANKGFAQREIEQIMGGNFLRVFQNILS